MCEETVRKKRLKGHRSLRSQFASEQMFASVIFWWLDSVCPLSFITAKRANMLMYRHSDNERDAERQRESDGLQQ